MRFAATQLRIEPYDVEGNLERAVALIRLAARKKADVVVLPEFFTTGIAIDDAMLGVPRRNRDAGVLDRLKAESDAAGISIAGSFLDIEGGDVYNAMVLVEPGGAVFKHRKDIPTQFENAYYTRGDIVRTHGIFGLALCWELLRHKTVSEFGPGARVVLAGSCWWSLPVGTDNLELDAYNDMLCGSTPATFAVAAGLPVVHSSLVGRIWTRRSLSRDEAVERRLVGAAMIVDHDGLVLASVASDDSDGIAIADIDIRSAGPRLPDGDGFWIPPMRDEYLKAWEAENRLGEERYFRDRAAMIAS